MDHLNRILKVDFDIFYALNIYSTRWRDNVSRDIHNYKALTLIAYLDGNHNIYKIGPLIAGSQPASLLYVLVNSLIQVQVQS